MKEKPAALLDRYLRARYPVIVIVSHEETRVIDEIKTLAAGYDQPKQVIQWTYTRGMFTEEPNSRNVKEAFGEETIEPSAALDRIIADQQDQKHPETIYVMRDIHPMLVDPRVIRQLRDVAAAFEASRDNLILISPVFQVPADLEKTVALIDWPLPDTSELTGILNRCEVDLPKKINVTLNGSRELVVQAMQGLTAFEASSVLLSAVVATRELGESAIPHIIKEKAQIIRKSGVLEYYDTTVTMGSVGGLGALKQYAQVKRAAFSEKARAAGVDAPKGVLLVGVPGTGKSLSAKAIAGGQMPLLRMDIGALMGGLVGQSEANMRSALKVASAVAPCVLWVDEIEKALSTNGSESDGGTSGRVFGTLLTWMQESTSPVYIVATANDARALKPELLRRFDDVYWVDLPDAAARAEILAIHLEKRRHCAEMASEALVSAVWGFSGAEIEKVVKSAVETAFFDGNDLTEAYLMDAARSIVPVSRTMKEQIKVLREWAKDRARDAGEPLEVNQPVSRVSRTADV